MSDARASTRRQALICPTCGQSGAKVKTATLRALLVEEAGHQLTKGSYRFCDAPGCDTVYYAEDGTHTFSKSDVTVRVGVKEAQAPRPICYCFDHTIEEIEDEVRRTGRSTVLNDIKTRMAAGCWCETKNPQGSCCLSVVSKYVKQALAQYGKETDFLSIKQDFGDCCATEGHVPGSAVSIDAYSKTPPTNRTSMTAQLGAVASAIMSLACCWLPLLLVSVGVSGAAISAALEQYRPVFLAISFTLLAAAFYLTYRPRLAMSNRQETETCCASTLDSRIEEASCCPPGGSSTLSMRKFNKVMLWVVTAVVLMFAFFPNYVGLIINGGNTARASTPLEDTSSNATEVLMTIEGMTCEACATRVRANLEKLPLVESAMVSFAEKRATVVVTSDGPGNKALVEAVEKAG